ncbi:MAG: hypothetical protein F6J95_024555 [Leptolyngbya sp. SIO1E4]|nr:hypothetical protein [Leptolyngbya sp. SIO1E4]
MRLWLLCCALLFIVAKGYDWITHQIWFQFPDLSLPWIVLGGIGLAIASNRVDFKPTSHQSVDASAPLPDLSGVAEANPMVPPAEHPIAPVPPRAEAKQTSISFEIASKERSLP